MITNARMSSIRCYMGEYNDGKNEPFQTILCDWECKRCNQVMKGVPEKNGKPSECSTCHNMSDKEVKSLKSGKLKLAEAS